MRFAPWGMTESELALAASTRALIASVVDTVERQGVQTDRILEILEALEGRVDSLEGRVEFLTDYVSTDPTPDHEPRNRIEPDDHESPL